MAQATAKVIRFPHATPAVVRVAGEPHPWVYALADGRVGRCPAARFTLPADIAETTAIAGTAVTRRTVEGLPLIAELLDRIVPWARVYVVPGLLRSGQGDFYEDRAVHYLLDGIRYATAGGTAYTAPQFAREAIVLCGSGGAVAMVETAAHEALHVLWPYLSDSYRAAIEAVTSFGPDWPGNYYCDPEERAARLFAGWVLAHLEGLPGRPLFEGELTIERMFTDMATGAFADAIIKAGLAGVPHAVKEKRGLLPPPPPSPSIAWSAGRYALLAAERAWWAAASLFAPARARAATATR